MQTPYAQQHVPDWVEKLENVSTLPEAGPQNLDESPSDQNEREEWMILSDLREAFTDSDMENLACERQHFNSTGFSELEVAEMPSWLQEQKNNFESVAQVDDHMHASADHISFSVMQKKSI